MALTDQERLNTQFVAVVPVRGGSKGFPGKNTALLNGRPLYQHAIDQALEAGAATVVVTTDITDILESAHPAQVVMRPRPAALATDDAPMADVITDALGLDIFTDETTVALLQATSPLRRPSDIRAAVDQFERGSADLVMSVCPANPGVLKYGTIERGTFTALRSPSHPFANRQDLPRVWRPNGAIYVFGATWYRANRSLATHSISPYVMPVEDSVDIDSPSDLDQCAERLATRERNEP